VVVRILAARRERWSFGFGGPEGALVVQISDAWSGEVVIEFLPLRGRGGHSNFSGLEGPARTRPHAGRGPAVVANRLGDHRLGSISNNFNGGQYVLYAVAAAVIGGTSLFGGRGKMLGAVLGGLVVGVIYNGLFLLGLGPAAQNMWTAAVLPAAVAVDALARRGSTSPSR
jgi:hypothetical protein